MWFFCVHIGSPISYISENRKKVEGEGVALICNVIGGLRIEWYHNNDTDEIIPTNRVKINNTIDKVTGQIRSKLEISPLRRTDDGVYKCSAYNHSESIDEKETYLTVECKLFII